METSRDAVRAGGGAASADGAANNDDLERNLVS
jgi:hypothetical protein